MFDFSAIAGVLTTIASILSSLAAAVKLYEFISGWLLKKSKKIYLPLTIASVHPST